MFNGWRNYETWDVKLWLDNDEGTQRLVSEGCRGEKTIRAAADFLENYVIDLSPDFQPSMFNDLLNHAIRRVDFYEIAKSYREEE